MKTSPKTVHLTTPLEPAKLKDLCVGDIVYLSGEIYTARDAAHKRIVEANDKTLAGKVIYYAGPCPAKPNEPIGSVGPTTAYRMDGFTKKATEQGLVYSIGKGDRAPEAVTLIQKAHGIHFDAIGGAGAYYKNCVKKSECIMYGDLGAEAVYRLTVVDFPVVVRYK